MDRKSVEHIAHLAKLSITESEIEIYTEQLSKILGYFDELSKVDIQNAEPLVTPSEIEYGMRADEVRPGLSATELLELAPLRAGNLFKVPPVV